MSSAFFVNSGEEDEQEIYETVELTAALAKFFGEIENGAEHVELVWSA